ncbi:MAG: RNB domain-containing ribonuclease, partial [Bacteroidota bacterium]
MSNTHEGVIMIRGKGTGFFSLSDDTDDVVIERANLNFALNGDIVEIELLPLIPGERQTGKVTRVVEPAHKEFVGVIKERQAGSEHQYYLSPDNHRIHIRPILPEAHAHQLGYKVVTSIQNWTQAHLDPVGTIIEVLGKAGDHETEMQAIIRSGGVSENFPEDIAAAAKELHDTQATIFADALQDPKRRDMRTATTFTIDPADAKDFDDALSLEQLENGNYSIG